MTPAMKTFHANVDLSCECGCDDHTSQTYTVEAVDQSAAHEQVKARLAQLKNPAKALWEEAEAPELNDWFVSSPESIPPFDPQDVEDEDGEDEDLAA